MSPTPHDNTVSGAEDLARPSGQALVSDQAPTGLAPTGFDPSRGGGARHTPRRLFYSSALARWHGDETIPYAWYCIVWQASDDPENPILFCETLNRETASEAYADARLIVAAPELLAALAKARDTLNAVYVGMGMDDAGRAQNLAFADAAIAKARGQ